MHSTSAPYTPRRHARTEWLPLRGLRHHLSHWGEPSTHGSTPWVMVHGWMDVGASFQFVVDALDAQGIQPWVIAPDWRGFGQTHSGGTDCFWFQDYLADLDAILDHVSPNAPVNLLGHSMGGNVAMVYAGIRPERVHKLVNLEGFGLPSTIPAQAPGRLTQWLNELQTLRQGGKDLRTYANAEAVAARLTKTNPRLSPDKALWLARHWAEPDASGQWHIRGEAAHKLVNPMLYRVEENLACWARIAAPVLAVEASHTNLAQWWQNRYTLDEYHQRLNTVPQVQTAVIQDAGHMLHHDQPEQLATLLESFLHRV